MRRGDRLFVDQGRAPEGFVSKLKRRAGPNVTFVDRLDFKELRRAYARARGISRLVALGEATQASVEAFGEGALHAASVEAAADAARDAATVLVKGSLFMGMNRVVAALTGETAEAH